jgi:hypothetical protein
MSRWSPVVALLACLLVMACGSGAPSSPPTSPPATAAASEPAPSDLAAAGPTAGQTDTEWGPIWDTVPSGFPTYPGSKAADVGTDPASAVRVVEGVKASAIASWMDEHLRAAAFRSDGLSGPFEDGSYVVDMSGASDCNVQVRVAPAGGTSMITVLYGAACPHG